MRSSLLIPLVFAAVIAAEPAQASKKGWDNASRVGEVALVAAALGLPAVEGDRGGLWQAGASVGVAFGASELLKESFPERRPDGSDNRSFPSGHTSISFASAATLHNRHGWEVGAPAYLVASFVGLARVEADKHHWYDVVAGAALGTATGLLITRRRDDKVMLMPWASTRGAGVAMAMRF